MFLYVERTLLVHIILLSRYMHSNSFDTDRKFPRKVTVCKTDECIHQASYIGGLLNHDINPCNDFYEYVCSNWEKKHPIPPSYPTWQIDSELEELAFYRIRKLLLETPTRSDSPDWKKAKALYKDCTEIPDLGKISGPTMRLYVEEAGRFPLILNETVKSKSSWLKTHNYYLSLTGESGFFNAYAMADARFDYNSLLHISRLKTPYGMILMNKRLTHKKEKIYRVFLATAVNRVIPLRLRHLPYLEVEKRLAKVFRFRDKLMQSLLVRGASIYSVLTVDNFNEWYGQAVSNDASTAKIPWIDVVSSLYNNSKTRRTVSDMIVNVKNKPYFRELARILSATPNDVIVNHIHLYFIERHLELDTYLYKMLVDVILQDGKLLGNLEYTGQRWQVCIVCNAMRVAMTKAYVKRYLPVSTRQKIESMIADLKNILLLEVMDSTWLDNEAIIDIIGIINSLTMAIDFEHEESMDEQSTDTTSVCIDTGIVDVFYSKMLNSISISAAYFESPLYRPTFPDTLTYGSIGTMLSHEMFHALEPIFVQYAKSSKSSCCSRRANDYETKKKCFLTQFDKVPVKELGRMKPAPTIDGHRTLEENIADSMGLRLSYETFKNKTLAIGSCEILPNLSVLNCEQTFFVSFASLFCSSLRVDTILHDLETDEHSTPRARVNGAVSNMEQFAKAFNCPKTSPMNPHTKCNLWD